MARPGRRDGASPTRDVTVLRIRQGVFKEITKGIGKLGNVLAGRFQQKTSLDILAWPYRRHPCSTRFPTSSREVPTLDAMKCVFSRLSATTCTSRFDGYNGLKLLVFTRKNGE